MSSFTPADRRAHRAGEFKVRAAPAAKTTTDRAHALQRQDHWLGGNAAQAQAEAEQQQQRERTVRVPRLARRR